MNRCPLVIVVAFVSACSTPTVNLSSPMSVTDSADAVFRLEENVTIKAKHAAPLTLRAGTSWRQIGTIEQGRVFDTEDQVVIVNSFDVHEAAIVTKDHYLVGYYLKVSETFVEAQAVPITLLEGE